MSFTVDDLLDTIAPDEHLPFARIMLYGAEGSTKTVTACSVGRADMKTILLESDPEGYVSLYNHPDIYYMPDGKTPRIRRFHYEGLSQIEAFAELLSDSEFDDCDTIVVDTTSGAVNADLDIITADRFKRKKIDEEVPDWPAYRLNQDRVRRVFTPLMRVEKHVVMTSHARQDKDKSNIARWVPDMPQAARNHLTRLCHMVGYLTAEVQESDDGVTYTRRMQVHPSKLILAKSRIGGLPVVLDNPDLRKIIQEWVDSGAILNRGEEELAPESEAVVSASNNSPENEGEFKL